MYLFQQPEQHAGDRFANREPRRQSTTPPREHPSTEFWEDRNLCVSLPIVALTD